jgi:hypothetical protein
MFTDLLTASQAERVDSLGDYEQFAPESYTNGMCSLIQTYTRNSPETLGLFSQSEGHWFEPNTSYPEMTKWQRLDLNQLERTFAKALVQLGLHTLGPGTH